MKSTDSLRFIAIALFIAALPSGAVGQPAPSASATASASAPASPASANVKPPPPPVVRGVDIPGERSPLPKKNDWAQAKEVSIEGFSSCKARLLREWLSIECTDDFGVSLVAGDPKDVHVLAEGELFGWDPVSNELKHSHVTAVLPIERGKARIVTFLDGRGGSGEGYGPAISGESDTIHVWWRDGDADPIIVATHPA